MIDLNKLEANIDKLFENETSDSLTKWLLNKRFGNVNVLLGKGEFVSLGTYKTPFFASVGKPNFVKENFASIPNNRFAA